MIILPTDTTALSPYNHDKVVEELNKVLATQSNNEMIEPVVQNSIPGIYRLTPHNTSVPLFDLPREIKPLGVKDNSRHLCFDARPYCRVDSMRNVVVNNVPEYEFNLTIAMLTQFWLGNEKHVLVNNCQELLLKIWTRWIGTTLNQKLLIDEMLQPTVNGITAYYLYCLLTPDEEIIDPVKFHRIVNIVAKASFNNLTNTEELLKVLPRLRNINDYIEALKNHTGTDRFAKITPGFLFSMLQFSWYGGNAVTITSVALEYPPVFIAMLYVAISLGGYTRTPLGKMIREAQSVDTNHYVKVVDSVLNK